MQPHIRRVPPNHLSGDGFPYRDGKKQQSLHDNSHPGLFQLKKDYSREQAEVI